MSNISLLDCTLRDGGYINNWEFGSHEMKKIVKHLVESKVEIIEVGFLTDMPHTADHSLFGSCKEIDAICKDKGASLIAAMIALGEKEIDPSSLPPKSDTSLDIVRLTFHRDDAEICRAIDFARCLMNKGYKVCMQPIGTAAYSDDALLALIRRINELSPYAFYLVDTLGSFYNDDLLRLIYLTDHNLAPEIRLGFHSHNNLQMSFSNAQKILGLRSPREFILDASLFGMGRGAGNLCTELIAKYTNSIGQSSYDIVNVLEAIENYIYPIYLHSSWGYNAHYYMAATHKCHPNYASYLMNKQTLTMNQVNLLLQNLPKESRHIFDKALMEKLYQNMQCKSFNDTDSINALSEIVKDRNILLLAPGATLVEKRRTILDFIEKNKPLIFSVNSIFPGFLENYVFISNNKRLFSLDYDSYNGKIIVTSNLPALNDNFLKVDYSKLCDYNFDEPDNAGMMLIRLLLNAGLKKVYLAGFDGFSSSESSNYYTDKMASSISRDEADRKNLSIYTQIKTLCKKITIEFVTPSIYQRIADDEV